MTGSTRSSDGLDDRRKRLLFRCWHRGTREMDLLLGRVESTVGSHTVVVTDCYRTSVPPPK